MKALVTFKHKSMKDYWKGAKYQYNKIIVDVVREDDIETVADFKILDILELLYPAKDGAGYDVLYQYEITKIDKNPYGKGE